MGDKTDLIEQRSQKLEEIRKLGHDPYPHRYELSHTVAELVHEFSQKSGQELEQEEVSVQTVGRLVNLRGHGKAGFADLQGSGERIQSYVRQALVGQENHQLFRLFDIGDIIGGRG